MITASQIAPLRMSSDDYEETERLKNLMQRLRETRRPLHLTQAEFDQALRWKLRNQYGRQRDLRRMNSDDIIQTVTGVALTIEHPDKDYECELRVNLLCSLRGVDVPVASAVLALVFPEDYCVIDFRGWRQVFDENRTVFSVPNYKRYLREIRRLAQELGWPPQGVDLAIWEYDRRNH